VSYKSDERRKRERGGGEKEAGTRPKEKVGCGRKRGIGKKEQ
jgi:hypothetical protein